MPPLTLSAVALAAAGLFSSFTHAAPLVSPVKRGNFDFGTTKVRGVDLGGWFVLEPWITPSLFEVTPSWVVDEWTMSEYYGKTQMKANQEQHWSTWITADDFSQIAALGLNFVRIPIGYWSISPIAGDPYVQGAYAYLNKALGWAADNGLSVMIDLHGAPGSQNGYDNSGRAGPIDWLTGDTANETLTALEKLKADHGSNPVVATIELVNEPAGYVLGFGPIENFYTEAYDALGTSEFWITIQDAFFAPSMWDSWASALSDIVIDAHYYAIFTDAALMNTTQEHISYACQYGSQMVSSIPTLAGEFSGALTDCATWLNGRNTGARYDGTYEGSSYIGSCDGLANGTVAGLTSQQQQDISQWVSAQQAAFEEAAGWIFWTWVTESAPAWTFKDLAAAGLVSANGANPSLCS